MPEFSHQERRREQRRPARNENELFTASIRSRCRAHNCWYPFEQRIFTLRTGWEKRTRPTNEKHRRKKTREKFRQQNERALAHNETWNIGRRIQWYLGKFFLNTKWHEEMWIAAKTGRRKDETQKKQKRKIQSFFSCARKNKQKTSAASTGINKTYNKAGQRIQFTVLSLPNCYLQPSFIYTFLRCVCVGKKKKLKNFKNFKNFKKFRNRKKKRTKEGKKERIIYFIY